MFNHDPLRISHEFQALALRLTATDRARHGGSSSDCFFGRHWPGARERDALAELHPEDPLRPGLLRWAEYFWLRRIESALDAHESQLRFAELHPPLPPFEQPLTLGAAQQMALQASGRHGEEAGAQASWHAYGRLARSLGEHRQLIWARRQEAWELMNGPSVAPLVALEQVKDGESSLEELATRLLDATDDAAEAFIRPGFSGFVRAALATQASDGWPARLVPETILQLLVGRELVRGLSLGPVPLPPRIAPTSFLRAGVAFGDAFSRAAMPRELPFVVACTVDGFSAKELGHRLAIWMTTEAFGRRRLSLGASTATLMSRQLRTALLAEARLAAVRLLLAHTLETDARELGAVYGRLFERVFQDEGMTPLGRFAVRRDEKTRFAALLAAAAREDEARERWDEDWLDNPRAREALRDDAARPMETSVSAKELERGLDEIVRRTHA